MVQFRYALSAASAPLEQNGRPTARGIGAAACWHRTLDEGGAGS